METISRFKGMEAQAIVLVLEDGITNQLLPKSYVGMSRARAMLTVVGSQNLHQPLSWA